MIYIILSDVHSNREALNAVLEDSKSYLPDKYICLGDLIGYGPEPNEIIDILQKKCDYIIAGNHDYAAVDKLDPSDFSNYALVSLAYNKQILTQKNKEFLSSLKEMEIVDDLFQIVHGSLDKPVTDYMINIWIAYTNFNLLKKNICFNGHTHFPIIFYKDENNKPKSIKMEFNTLIKIFPDKFPYFINPGSVGQPRDNNPTASYIIYDSDKNTIQCNRVTYDILSVQRKMKAIKMPDFLIERLSLGK